MTSERSGHTFFKRMTAQSMALKWQTPWTRPGNFCYLSRMRIDVREGTLQHPSLVLCDYVKLQCKLPGGTGFMFLPVEKNRDSDMQMKLSYTKYISLSFLRT